MGRGRTRLVRIEDEKVRKTTFKNRSKIVMKKVSEFSNECEGADACLIICDGDRNSNAPPMTFPKDTRVVKSMLEKYDLEKHQNPPNISDLEEYYNNKIRVCEAEISKVKKEIMKIKYPTMVPSCFNNTGKEQLSAFIAMLDAKSRASNQRINMLKSKQQSEAQQQIVASSYPNHQFSFMQNNIPQTQSIPAAHMIMNPHNGSNDGMVAQRINMLMRMEQESDDNFSYMQNMAQRQIVASSSSVSHHHHHHPNHQFSFMQNNIPHHHMIMQPHNNSDRNGMVGFTNHQVGVTLDSANQLIPQRQLIPAHMITMQPLSQNQVGVTLTDSRNQLMIMQPHNVTDRNGMVGFTNHQVGVTLDSANQLIPQRQLIPAHMITKQPQSQNQVGVTLTDSRNELMIMQPHKVSDRNGMVGFTNQVGVSLDSRNQLCEPMKLPFYNSLQHYQAIMQPHEDQK